jgi:hypothetical protein
MKFEIITTVAVVDDPIKVIFHKSIDNNNDDIEESRA